MIFFIFQLHFGQYQWESVYVCACVRNVRSVQCSLMLCTPSTDKALNLVRLYFVCIENNQQKQRRHKVTKLMNKMNREKKNNNTQSCGWPRMSWVWHVAVCVFVRYSLFVCIIERIFISKFIAWPLCFKLELHDIARECAAFILRYYSHHHRHHHHRSIVAVFSIIIVVLSRERARQR